MNSRLVESVLASLIVKLHSGDLGVNADGRKEGGPNSRPPCLHNNRIFADADWRKAQITIAAAIHCHRRLGFGAAMAGGCSMAQASAAFRSPAVLKSQIGIFGQTAAD